jgi:8-oxo-dGTP diphosphatase
MMHNQVRSDGYLGDQETRFCGAKLFLQHGGRLLTYLRDDFSHIPFPGHWDLPGGGREGGESPIDCALRELWEEFGLRLAPAALSGRAFPSVRSPGRTSWLFTGRLSRPEIAAIRFGNEGQEWRMMPLAEFLFHPLAVPHFKEWIRTAQASAP